MDDEEIPLTGGRVTAGVVKVGDTIRRPPPARSAFVHAFLGHLEAIGFDAAPRFLGTDGQGRDILSYIDGYVPPELGWWSDNQLAAAAVLIRRLHDATAGTPLAQDAEVVCHNDLSPCNVVFVDGTPSAIIDFDAAAPGARLFDVGYATWLWLDIGNSEMSVREQMRRLSLFAASYGVPTSRPLIDAMMLRQRMLRDEGVERNLPLLSNWANKCLTWASAHLLL